MQPVDPNRRSVLITGCSTGIGLSVAHGLKERGYQVFATARKIDDVEHLKQSGFNSFLLDYDDTDSLHRAMESILTITDGKLYALFNNGAFGQPGALEDLSRAALRKQFETNVFGWHELTNLVIPVMRAQGYGRIIQNSSVLGLISLRYRGAYNASKYAIEGLSDTLRLELRGTDIKVSLIEPGPIESRFRANALVKFQENIDVNNSAHSNVYEEVLKRLETEGQTDPFTLPPEAVLKKVIHALESRFPANHYPVTFPTYLFSALKRLLPSWALDYILYKV